MGAGGGDGSIMVGMSPRFEVTVWPPFARTHAEQSYHVRDNQTRGEVLGRWSNRDDAQAHADQCNERSGEQT